MVLENDLWKSPLRVSDVYHGWDIISCIFTNPCPKQSSYPKIVTSKQLFNLSFPLCYLVSDRFRNGLWYVKSLEGHSAMYSSCIGGAKAISQIPQPYEKWLGWCWWVSIHFSISYMSIISSTTFHSNCTFYQRDLHLQIFPSTLSQFLFFCSQLMEGRKCCSCLRGKAGRNNFRKASSRTLILC